MRTRMLARKLGTIIAPQISVPPEVFQELEEEKEIPLGGARRRRVQRIAGAGRYRACL